MTTNDKHLVDTKALAQALSISCQALSKSGILSGLAPTQDKTRRLYDLDQVRENYQRTQAYQEYLD